MVYQTKLLKPGDFQIALPKREIFLPLPYMLMLALFFNLGATGASQQSQQIEVVIIVIEHLRLIKFSLGTFSQNFNNKCKNY